MEFSGDFLLEILKQCITSRRFLEVIKPHLKTQYLPSQHYKELYQYISDYHTTYQRTPTFGIVSQAFGSEADKINLLAKIKHVDTSDREEALLVEVERYVKRAMFVTLHNDVKNMYEEGKKEEAPFFMEKRSAEINALSFKSKRFKRVIGDYLERHETRIMVDESNLKPTWMTYVPQLDHITGNQLEGGDSVIILCRPGQLKTTWLRWVGYAGLLQGANVVHFQTDAKTGETEGVYDSIVSGMERWKVKSGNLSNSDFEAMHQSWEYAKKNFGEIFVVDYNILQEPTIIGAKQDILELKKDNKIDIAIYDYLDMFSPGGQTKYNGSDGQLRNKLYQTAENMVALGREQDLLTFTGKQTKNITDRDSNNPNFWIGEEHIGEAKHVVRPFSYAFSSNRTIDEEQNEIARLRLFKYRALGRGVTPNHFQFKIATDLNSGRFIDSRRTHQEFWSAKDKNQIQ